MVLYFVNLLTGFKSYEMGRTSLISPLCKILIKPHQPLQILSAHIWMSKRLEYLFEIDNTKHLQAQYKLDFLLLMIILFSRFVGINQNQFIMENSINNGFWNMP
jgi:hypothetical protein